MCTHQNALTQGGYGIPKDEKRSFRFYEMAAQQGHAGAQFNIGNNVCTTRMYTRLTPFPLQSYI